MLFRRRALVKHGLMRDQPVEDGRCDGCTGECCRGFFSVALTPEEYGMLERLGARRLEFTLAGDFYLIIEHGCEFLRENRCGIYDHRPDVCRRFTCSDDEGSGLR